MVDPSFSNKMLVSLNLNQQLILTAISTLKTAAFLSLFLAIEETLLYLGMWMIDAQPLGVRKRKGREDKMWRGERDLIFNQ